MEDGSLHSGGHDSRLRDSEFGFETENWGAGGIVLKRVFPFTFTLRQGDIYPSTWG